jgi:hypothetical protein
MRRRPKIGGRAVEDHGCAVNHIAMRSEEQPQMNTDEYGLNYLVQKEQPQMNTDGHR